MKHLTELFLLIALCSSTVSALAQCDINAINAAMQGAGCIPLDNLPGNCQNSCSMYFYNPQSMTGSQAQNFAQNFGANLISIGDANENACITAALQQFGGVIWIGFNDSQSEGTFEWYDQSTVNYTNWNPATPEPNNNTPSCCNVPIFGCSGDPECTEGEDCVQIFPDGLWNDLYCGSSNSSSVIEFNLCPEVTITASSPNVCIGGNVTLSATTILGSNPYTYLWMPGALSGATVTVNPTTTTTYTVTSTDRYGCEATETVTITVDPCQPPLSTCDLNLITQTFTNAGCIPLNLPQQCASGCSMYFFNPQSLTGSQAQAFARNYGANLISIADATENACITTALQQYGGVIWLGFNDEQVEGTFEWYDQSPITYTNWAAGEPNQSGNEDCTQIYPTGQWNDLDCNSNNSQSVIEVNLCPEITITASANNVCAGTQITLNASTILGSDPYSYTWETNQSGASITVAPTQTTTYTVTVTDRYSCSTRDSITVDILPTPTTTFTTSSPACENEPVTITYTGNGSGNATYTWGWDGGTVLSGSGSGPYQVSWATAGTKNITLDAVENGCTSTQTTEQVVINPNPTADFIFTTECFGTPTTLTNTSVGNGGTIAGYLWVIGTDSLLGADQTYTFPNAGTFTVNMGVATVDGCIDQTSQQVTVHPNPTVDFDFDLVCLNEATTFTNTSTPNGGVISSYLWDFGGGNTSAAQDTTFTFATAGQNPVTLIAYSDQNCTDTITQIVDVNENPVANFLITDVCADSLVQFQDQSTITAGTINAWDWDFDGNGTSTDQDPFVTFSTPGTYDIELIAYAGTCSDTTSKQITIFENPVADFNTQDVCLDVNATFLDASTSGTATIGTYYWQFGDAGTSASANPTHQYLQAGTYTVTLTVTTTDNCVHSVSYPITIFPEPTAQFTVEPVCLNEPSIFDNTSGVDPPGSIATYTWDFDDTNTSNQQFPQHTYTDPGTYTVTLDVVTGDGCADNTTADAVVYPLPVADFYVLPEEACQPDEIQLIDQSTVAPGTVVSWNWIISNGETSTQSSPSFYFTNDGTYDVFLKVASNNGCLDSLTITDAFIIHPKPEADFSFDPQPASEFNPVIDFTDESEGASVWFYDFGDGVTAQPEPDQQHEYRTYGTYTAIQIVYTEHGCSDTIQYDVIIDRGFAFYIPTAFTPNSNARNDYFFAKGVGYEEYNYVIFDRWGKQVHIGNEGTERWDGTFRDTGFPAPQGVYNYRYEVIDFSGDTHVFTGSVTLIR